uniref:Uncharacterized protein n=1 Tax=viral metagenome TaxID=1070528 RepID=A0A6M3LX01_9ZZZZ
MKKRRTKEEIKTETALRFALAQEERYMGSVFVTSHGQRQHEEKVKAAYANYRKAGGTKDI